MARKDRKDRKGAAAGGRVTALLDAGDHGRAAAEARALLADAKTPEVERAEAAVVLASLAPDRGVVLAGAMGVAVALALVAWTLLAG
jgi:hypothetical protein